MAKELQASMSHEQLLLSILGLIGAVIVGTFTVMRAVNSSVQSVAEKVNSGISDLKLEVVTKMGDIHTNLELHKQAEESRQKELDERIIPLLANHEDRIQKVESRVEAGATLVEWTRGILKRVDELAKREDK